MCDICIPPGFDASDIRGMDIYHDSRDRFVPAVPSNKSLRYVPMRENVGMFTTKTPDLAIREEIVSSIRCDVTAKFQSTSHIDLAACRMPNQATFFQPNSNSDDTSLENQVVICLQY